MPVHVEIEHPDQNAVYLSPKFLDGGGHVRITGTNNSLHIEDPLVVGSPSIQLTGSARIVIGKDCSLGELQIHAIAPGVSIEIGPWTSFNGSSQLMAHEPARVTIGKFCLFGPDCIITASDVHQILHADDGERLNPADDITIEDHVWCGPRVAVLRGSHISRDSVVGLGSVVTGKFRSNVLIAGAPARIQRDRVTWKL